MTGVLGHSTKTELRDANDARNANEANRLHDETVRYYVANGILLAGALVTGGVTGYLHFSRKSDVSAGTEVGRLDPDGFGLRLAPELDPRSGRLTLSGRF